MSSVNLRSLQTKTINNSLNPVWADKKFDSDRYVFDFPIHDEHTQIIHVECFDDDDTSTDDVLGSFRGNYFASLI